MTARITCFAYTGRLFAAALFCAEAIAPVRAASDDMTIVIGERIGPFELGMDEAALAAAAGPPQSRLMQGRDTVLSWGLITARIPAGAMGTDEITVNDTRYLTAARLHVGSTDLAVEMQLGKPDKRSVASGLVTLDYSGISTVLRNGFVMQIRIHK